MLAVTTGVTVATCTAEPLLTPSEWTMAIRLPAVVGLVENVTVSEVALAVLTVPTAPSLKATVSLEAVAPKPKPLIVIWDALAARLAVLDVTDGVTVATWRAVPLLSLSVVTMAVRLPAVVGSVVNVTVSADVLAVFTVPTAPSLNVTVSLAAVGSKPKPLIVIWDGSRPGLPCWMSAPASSSPLARRRRC